MKEAARYLGIKRPDELTEQYIAEMEGVAAALTPAFSYALFSVKDTENGVSLIGTDVMLSGNLAKKHFNGCDKIIVVLATLGLKSEVLLKRIFAQSAAKGVVLDAVYTAKIEDFLDEIEGELRGKYGPITTRISCGYGDLPIETQVKLFDLVGGEKLGVGINECCMLTPNKSVIALIGVK